jgi:hypothetical protein
MNCIQDSHISRLNKHIIILSEKNSHNFASLPPVFLRQIRVVNSPHRRSDCFPNPNLSVIIFNMNTRGLFGFQYKSKYYLVYNHYNSHPKALGNDLAKEIRTAIKNQSFNNWLEIFLSLTIIDENRESYPTREEITKLRKYHCDHTPLNRRKCEWFILLRKCQGSFERVMKSGYLLNWCSEDFQIGNLGDFEKCDKIQYCYVINFRFLEIRFL